MALTKDWIDRFADVSRFLREHAPSDVLMPVATGEKSPMFGHINRRWTWWKLDEWTNRESVPCPDSKDELPLDACVILQQLCVIDVDNVGVALRMEARFPELRLAPCERTSRGRHYWFWRSLRADVDGYYDGSSQRVKGVDFKTVCRSGTGGIVVIAPSTNKTWLRHLCGLTPISDALLAEVAIPHHACTPLRCQFLPDDGTGDVVMVNRGFAAACAYFEPFLDNAGGFDDETPCLQSIIPVPASLSAFRTLVGTIMQGDAELVPLEEMLAVERLCDKLGYRNDIATQLLANGNLLWRLDLRSMWPAASDADEEERRWSGGPLRIVGAHPVVYAGMLGSESSSQYELFRTDEKTYRPPPVGTVLVGDDIAATLDRDMPSLVTSFLRLWPGTAILAGGSVLGHVVSPKSGVAMGDDYDFFVASTLEDVADDVARSFVSHFGGPALKGKDVYRTSRAWTIRVRSRTSKEYTQVQLVLRMFDTPQHVMTSFDLAPTRIGTWFDPVVGSLHTEAADSWFVAMSHLSFVVEPRHWSRASVFRTSKYVAKGLTAYAPGMRRDMLGKKHQLIGPAVQYKASGLLFVELEMRTISGTARRPTLADLPSIAVSLRHTSDYETTLRATGRIWHVVKTIANRLLRLRCSANDKKEEGGKSPIRTGPPQMMHDIRQRALDMPLWHRVDGSPMVPCVCGLAGMHMEKSKYNAAARDTLRSFGKLLNV